MSFLFEVEGAHRLLADTVYITEERRGLYSNDNEALKFSDGVIIRDSMRPDFENGMQ